MSFVKNEINIYKLLIFFLKKDLKGFELYAI